MFILLREEEDDDDDQQDDRDFTGRERGDNPVEQVQNDYEWARDGMEYWFKRIQEESRHRFKII